MKQKFGQILSYLESGLADEPVFAWVLAETTARQIPAIQITPQQGRFLHLLARTLNAERILEIGTLSGYSGLWLARALPPQGRLITLEVNERHAALAREAFARGGVADRVELHVGPAVETLARLQLDRPLDLTFIDADKGNNRTYLEWALERTRPGGMVVVDNVLANGGVTEEPPATEYARTIAEFNAYAFARYGDAATVIPFYKLDEDNLDGVLVVHKDGNGAH